MAKRKRLSPVSFAGGEPASPALASSPSPTARAPIAEVSGDAATRAAFDEVAGELSRARAEGRMVLKLPLEAVVDAHLVRDRIEIEPEAFESLVESLRARGQQTPVDVVDLGKGRYGLISGFRRLLALRRLAKDDESGAFSHIQALVRAPRDAAAAYQAMVEENEIRADLSFFERARIAIVAVDQGIYPDAQTAVQSLYQAARAPKRSKILSFTALVRDLGDRLAFPAAIPEKTGLALVRRLTEDPGFRRSLREALRKAAPADAAAERQVLERALTSAPPAPAAKSVPKPVPERGETGASEVAPGLTLRRSGGALTLSGPGVTAALEADLSVWLRARSAGK